MAEKVSSFTGTQPQGDPWQTPGMAGQWTFCGKCGGQVTPVDRFCPWCGHELALPEE
ncbi:MAG TPA: hypothetical protein DCZ35_02920 [Acidimicrobiaceae bacterium]|nr:hypothetical protein [Acidimicrobiaceae bacterium]